MIISLNISLASSYFLSLKKIKPFNSNAENFQELFNVSLSTLVINSSDDLWSIAFNIKSIEESIVKRQKIASTYDRMLNQFISTGFLRKQSIASNVSYNYSYYPVIFKTKMKMLATKKALEKNSVYPRRYFYPSLNKLPFLHSTNECMVSEDISQKILCLPSYDDLTENEIKKIVMIISESLM